MISEFSAISIASLSSSQMQWQPRRRTFLTICDSRLRTQLSEEQLMELSAQIAFENFRARLNRVFDVGSDELYKPAAPGS
jgi:hypothetical protein